MVEFSRFMKSVTHTETCGSTVWLGCSQQSKISVSIFFFHFSLAPCLKSFFWTWALPEEVCDTVAGSIPYPESFGNSTCWKWHTKKKTTLFLEVFALNPLFTWLQVCSLLLAPICSELFACPSFLPKPNTVFLIISKWTISENFPLATIALKASRTSSLTEAPLQSICSVKHELFSLY